MVDVNLIKSVKSSVEKTFLKRSRVFSCTRNRLGTVPTNLFDKGVEKYKN